MKLDRELVRSVVGRTSPRRCRPGRLSRPSHPSSSAVIFAGLGTVYTFVQLHLAPKRFVKVNILPVLARALEPLQPTQAAIEDGLAHCKSTGLKIGSSIKPDDLWTELQQRTLRSMR